MANTPVTNSYELAFGDVIINQLTVIPYEKESTSIFVKSETISYKSNNVLPPPVLKGMRLVLALLFV